MTSYDETALFVPTTAGPVSGVLALPAEGSIRGPGVLLLPGGRAGAGILPLFQEISRRLAAGGQPVLRFDYPGSGLSSHLSSIAVSEFPSLAGEMCDWLRRTASVDALALAGRCAGARLALAVSAARDDVAVCVGAVPFFMLGGNSLRAKLARLDARGPRLAEKVVRRPRVGRVDDQRRSASEISAALASDLDGATGKSRVTLVFGERDHLLEEYLELTADLGREVLDRIELVVLPEARLHGLPDVDDERVLGDILAQRLSAELVGA